MTATEFLPKGGGIEKVVCLISLAQITNKLAKPFKFLDNREILILEFVPFDTEQMMNTH